MNTSSEDAHFVWRSLLDSAKHYHKDRWRFLHDCDRDARISILRNACIEPTMEGMALEIIAVLRPEEQLDLLCPLLQLVAESNIYIEPRPDSIVLSLPRELVVGRINECIDLIKKRDEYDSFSPVLYFLHRLDTKISLQFAHDLILHSDRNVQIIGEEYIHELRDCLS